MENLNELLRAELARLGADLIGFGDLRDLPPDARHNLPIGISMGICVPPEIATAITEAPTLEYWDYYHSGGKDLAKLSRAGAEFIRSLGFEAISLVKENEQFIEKLRTALPQKTVATRAGLGWIGKCAMIATEEYGTAVWLATILTDAPLETAEPINESKCGECNACKDGCPAKAISGKLWNSGMKREDFFDAFKCAMVARERATALIDVNYPLCGKCIAVCPRTLRYLKTCQENPV